MEPHTHISPVHLLAGALAVVAIFGTAHLLSLTYPNSRGARAWLALGF